MELKHYAAIDIGTNAGRLLIAYVMPEGDHMTVKKVQLCRVPLRLGEDVFSEGKILADKESRFIHTMKAFKHLMKAYNVIEYRAVGTSAMREASNGMAVSLRILQETGINVDIIDGEQEADYIFTTFPTQKIDRSKSYLFIDVGGGSTELTIIKKGKRFKSKSFQIGTLRSIKKKQENGIWEKMESWLGKHCNNGEEFSAIGTGGNANRLVKLQNKKYLHPLSPKEIKESRDYVDSFTMQERIEKLRLKPDRADVIVPAADIYMQIMKMAKIDDMYVPKMGVTDGIIYSLYEREQKGKR